MELSDWSFDSLFHRRVQGEVCQCWTPPVRNHPPESHADRKKGSKSASSSSGYSSSGSGKDSLSPSRRNGNPSSKSVKASSRPGQQSTKRKAVDEAASSNRKEAKIVTPPFSLTPYRALQELSGAEILIQVQIGWKRDFVESDPHLWQCLITCGDLEVKVDSNRKEVAREVACNEFLTQLARRHPNCRIPAHVLPEQLLIDPQIRNVRPALNGKEVYFEFRTKEAGKCGAEQLWNFVFMIHIGSKIFEGEHYLVECAKSIAIRKVYLHFLGREPTCTPHFTGEFCDPIDLYRFTDNHVYEVRGYAKSGLTVQAESKGCKFYGYSNPTCKFPARK